MIWHEIVKYSSENYGENGVYTKDEWTSRSDIGTVYEGKTFTLEKYLDVEQRYINVVLSIMDVTNCSTTVQRNFPIRSTDHHRSHSEDVWA